MRNVFDGSINEKSTIEYPNFLISILKSPTPFFLVNNGMNIQKYPTQGGNDELNSRFSQFPLLI
jgi:hypothetical protein